MKSVWKGSISFGLVNIPIRLYLAVEQGKVAFRLLHKKDGVPIKYKRICPKDGKEVGWEDIEKGLEIRKGKYFVLGKDEIESIRPKRSDTIDITSIVGQYQIDPVFVGRHYYAGPDKPKEKAFFLLKYVLEHSGKAAIGKFVLHENEYVCAIRPYRSGLLLSTLNYSYEVRDIGKMDFASESPEARFSKEEVELANQLVGRLVKEDLDMTKFKDTFIEDLKKLVRRKMAGKAVEVRTEAKVKKHPNLVEALKASL